MVRVFNLILLVAMVVGAAVTYDMKYKAETAAGRVAALQGEIAREKERITLLKAEWSMLTQPARLQETIARHADHFRLQPFTPAQIAAIGEIPLKPVGIDPGARDAIARLAAGDGMR